MKNRIASVIFFSYLLSIVSCDTENHATPFGLDCNLLKTGLLQNDNALISPEIAKLVKDLNPAPNNSDEIGHSNNCDILIGRLNKCENISAELLCYACIKTYPAQTEILLRIDSAGEMVSRVIDISTPEDIKLSYIRIHQSYSDEIKLSKINHLGCMYENRTGALKDYTVPTDTIFLSALSDTLTLHVVKNYNCCGILKDSISINDNLVNIYISDICLENCLCNCMCNFGFEFLFTDFALTDYKFKVHLKGLNASEYQLFKEIQLGDLH